MAKISQNEKEKDYHIIKDKIQKKVVWHDENYWMSPSTQRPLIM